MVALLVVDPDPSDGKSHRAMLELAGYAVSVESDAGAALDHLREGGFDALIVDSAVDGFEDLMAGLQKLPDPPPLILHSNDADAPQASARYGAAQFLPKPCNAEDLLGVIADIVDMGGTPTAVDDVPTHPVERTGPYRADTES